jgi:hypothetical protein
MREEPPDQDLRKAAEILRKAAADVSSTNNTLIDQVERAKKIYTTLTTSGVTGDILPKFTEPWIGVWQEVDHLPDHVDYTAEMLEGEAETYQEEYDCQVREHIEYLDWKEEQERKEREKENNNNNNSGSTP